MDANRSPFDPFVHRTILTPAAEATDRVITQGCALARAIEGIGVIEPSAWFERAIAGLLLAAYKRRLRAIVGAAPVWVGDRILGAVEGVPDPYGTPSGRD